MSLDLGLLGAYSATVLGFGFKGAEAPPDVPAAPAPADLERMAGRVAEAFARSGREHLALLGLGSGALATELARRLPAGSFCACEQDLGLVRALAASGALPPPGGTGPAWLAADASPWALFLLLDRAGAGPADTLALPNPELAPRAKAAHRPLELLLARSRLLAAAAGAPVPRLSAAAILSPSEPDLPGFFAQFPDWLAELVLVWDAPSLPDGGMPGIVVPDRFPVRQLARPLGADFSAQRNAMLAACAGDWALYLDADERLSTAAWAAVPALCAVPGTSAWHFPRLTPYPDVEHALVGFGLWPDMQLRLFRNAPGLRFVNPVHERLAGVAGGQGLAPDVEIEHLSRLRKSDEDLRRKLSGFDEAGEGRVRHALSAEYPSVPRSWLAARPEPAENGRPRRLLLPPEFA